MLPSVTPLSTPSVAALSTAARAARSLACSARARESTGSSGSLGVHLDLPDPDSPSFSFFFSNLFYKKAKSICPNENCFASVDLLFLSDSDIPDGGSQVLRSFLSVMSTSVKLRAAIAVKTSKSNGLFQLYCTTDHSRKTRSTICNILFQPCRA